MNRSWCALSTVAVAQKEAGGAARPEELELIRRSILPLWLHVANEREGQCRGGRRGGKVSRPRGYSIYYYLQLPTYLTQLSRLVKIGNV